MSRLKEARYPCWGYGRSPEFPEYNHVLYVVLGSACYFSGTDLRWATSTINAAESIILAIAKQEEIAPDEFRWFDLQTHAGYESLGTIVADQPGNYILSELQINFKVRERRGEERVQIETSASEATAHLGPKHSLYVYGWPDVECPPQVLELFREQIGPNPRNVGQVASNPAWVRIERARSAKNN